MADYPWYEVVQGDSLEQGDILPRCPVFSPPDRLLVSETSQEESIAEFDWVERDLTVISQTCDLVKGREKVSDVLFCAIWSRGELSGHLATPRGLEDARRGNLPPYHLLAPCELPGLESDISIVDFRRVYSLPLSYVRRFASGLADRIRLLPPYREHLAQAFARFFMRVGLPVDIPPFK